MFSLGQKYIYNSADKLQIVHDEQAAVSLIHTLSESCVQIINLNIDILSYLLILCQNMLIRISIVALCSFDVVRTQLNFHPWREYSVLIAQGFKLYTHIKWNSVKCQGSIVLCFRSFVALHFLSIIAIEKTICYKYCQKSSIVYTYKYGYRDVWIRE